ncbi:LysR family transcriptional regulator [Paracidovorax cattleyae]|uniref:DNA-binding transcriptional regulator, LysR family n=1 Tax=Paracidovorax cattleyae TaxID=80868 RepID=A0A1H0WAM4_9BURK|nr:LysR family transcriptional regulator [Paracidovorax cattleyae]SDP87747.1 DNA-binding transcriptional regulator, LysR family [Paracidovorax cattleyae]
MRDIDLTSLRLFVAVCQHRNLARAGEQEHISTSAVSKRIAQLEAQIGAPLFERHRRGVVLTSAAEVLLDHARSMLASVDRIARDMGAYRHGVKGQVRMLASVSSITESLPDDIAAFLQKPENTQMRVDIEERTSTDLVRAIRDGIAPLGICWDAADLDGLTTQPYRRDRLAVAVHPGHPLAALPQCSFAQTLDYEHVGLPMTTAVYSTLGRAAALAGKPLHYRAVVSTFDAALRCVRAGLGVAVVPQEISAPWLGGGAVKVVTLAEPWASRRFCLCYRVFDDLSPAAQKLALHLASLSGTDGDDADASPT